MTHLLLTYGLVLLFAVVALESAGVPLPGETGLIAAAVLASQGHYSIVTVIAIAAVAAIIGDNTGYAIARWGGRRVLHRIPVVGPHVERLLPGAERFFRKHGGKAVFFGRFVSILRVTVAWLAGLTKMHWLEFLIWNAAGGILWATLFGTVTYYAGKTAADAIGHYGLYAGIGIVILIAISLVGMRYWHKRMTREISG